MGELSPQWNGGIRDDGSGYTDVWSPYHPYADTQGYVAEHRLIVEKFLKRFLIHIEEVHHINHDRKDNRLENLYLFPNHSEHMKIGHNKSAKLRSNLE